MNIREQLDKEYDLLFELFGVQCSLWSQSHETFSYYMFCPKNRKAIIAEYLIWEDFVKRAKEHNVSYYFGIDAFLEAYHKAVYSCLTI